MATGAFPAETESVSTLEVLIPEMWSARMNNFYRENLYAVSFFTDLSSELAGGGDIVHVPNLSEMTAHSKTNATVVTVNNPTETDIDLTVTTWYECSFAIEKREAQLVMKSYRIQETYAKNAAYTVGAVYEDAILALFPSFAHTVGTSAAALADSNIVRALQYLDDANVPQEDRAFFLTPKQVWNDLAQIDKFSLLVNTVGADPVLKGHVGYLYGVPVIKSSRIDATDGSANSALVHKDAIIHASTIMDVDTNYVPQYMSYLTTADVMYGVIENRDTSGVWIKTASAV